MKIHEANELLLRLFAASPHIKVNPGTAKVWAMTLDDVPYPLAAAAVDRWLRECKGFPYPVEIRELAVEARTGLPAPEAAWLLACERANLPAGHPDLSRPWEVPAAVLNAVHSLGGIRVIRESTAPERLRRDFLAAYAASHRAAVMAYDFGRAALPDGMLSSPEGRTPPHRGESERGGR